MRIRVLSTLALLIGTALAAPAAASIPPSLTVQKQDIVTAAPLAHVSVMQITATGDLLPAIVLRKDTATVTHYTIASTQTVRRAPAFVVDTTSWPSTTAAKLATMSRLERTPAMRAHSGYNVAALRLLNRS